jgi:probable F420-dependent oxidoreductase
MIEREEIEFGYVVWSVGAQSYANEEAFRRLGPAAEDSGFDTLWVPDHITIPESIPDDYPISPDGEPRVYADDNAYDAFAVIGYLAALTDDVTIGTNTCIAALRHPVLLAKQIQSVESLTGGRFEFGVASGWLSTEFEVLDIPFEERGGRLDEFLRLFKRIVEADEEVMSFDGEYHDFQRTGFLPEIERPGGPRVWIGGWSGATFRRIGEFGDGWTTFWTPPDEIESARDRMLNAWEDYDRVGEPEIALGRGTHVGTDTELDDDRLFIGDPESIIEDIETYRQAGVTQIVVAPFHTRIDKQLKQIRRFEDEVLPAFR